ncbi:prepilin peptidase [Burkholderia sp. SIMBA_043]|uniref:Prepilin peptidase n=1 Tax=Burkholderia vietnamiensis TaxID=60552 RepID=A0A118FCR3_BURVI|nr:MULTISPECIES: prepilin peptidase [Burkholderia]AJY07767.1 type IV leader peptidase family protein [Burkholderia vietnamiensis LMG 10929]AVR17485.1 hypothetical protein A8H33_30280 [Burkholderia vietnamiensis]KVE95934.1 hypothetical protein WJ03_00340 [Burkholderia vietnamiensis]KVF25648.1 hypothetical protein WJ07_10450 [Burkholderia vietnamiensis]KVG13401.1 hypothetical protein WJ24_03350 [Burkholderia vietnamiensis]
MAHFLFTGAFLAWALVVAASDIRYRRISNVLVLAGLVAGFLAASLDANPFGVLPVRAMIGMFVGLIVLLPFFLLRVMGAADVKIFAVLGAWCGANALLWVWVAASLAAGVHVLVLMLLSRTRIRALRSRRAPVLMVGGYRATPYAACLVAPVAAWLVYLVMAGAGR